MQVLEDMVADLDRPESTEADARLRRKGRSLILKTRV